MNNILILEEEFFKPICPLVCFGALWKRQGQQWLFTVTREMVSKPLTPQEVEE